MIPLVFGMLVIVPPQAYDQIVEALGYPAGFLDFYLRHYFAFGPQFCPNPCILLPTWNHLWFVAYLWVYTMALGGVLVAAPGLAGWIERWLAPLLSGGLLLVVPSLAVRGLSPDLAAELSFDACAVRRLVQSRAVCATVFLLGFLLAHADAFWDAIERQRWIALSLGGGVLPVSSRVALRPATPRCRHRRCRGFMAGSPMAAISGFALSPCSALRGAGSRQIQPRAAI